MSAITYSAKKNAIKHDWFVIDAENRTLGRLATVIATYLKGKHKAIFTPHLDTGDYIIVINADKIHVSGNKLSDKYYYHHSGYPGGIKGISLQHLLQKKPTKPVYLAVKRMLPRSPLGREMMKKLKIYAGSEHPHTAQQPKILNIDGRTTRTTND